MERNDAVNANDGKKKQNSGKAQQPKMAFNRGVKNATVNTTTRINKNAEVR